MILKLRDDCRLWINDHDQIANKFVEDFSKRLKSSHTGQRTLTHLGLPRLITDLENRELIRLPTLEEVKIALFSIDSNKTPGPDGFGAGFFKTYWNIIKKDLFNCITEFFTNGKLLKELNETFITLIPEKQNPVQTNQFRPINLCSTLYKIIAKILINRL